MQKFVGIFSLLLLIACHSANKPYPSEWKHFGNEDRFYLGIPGKASEKAKSVESLSMRQSSCRESADLYAKSPYLWRKFIITNAHNITKEESKAFETHLISMQLKPVLEECQSILEPTLSDGEWYACECLYFITYPGGKVQFEKDLHFHR
ncbi:hypothetical protein LPTSP4_33440 [Leptospira ryugenii]|uniref:Lipoprotein n=1 Tax=Leptospira ryugenii TaxID=1917863 RepID=A0A2P2E4M7_9LEPT|nr:hypothetical protein [Leptospira ryugenii]GBF51806.1 hypothetical protein LPTSP4_33440 [Leptospira ryugenii]